MQKTTGVELDARSTALGGHTWWIRSNLQMYSKSSTLKCHDWLHLIQDAGDYVLHGLYPDDPRKLQALHALVEACKGCLTKTSAFDSENREELDRLKLRVIEALSRCEAVLPKTEQAVMFHILMHVPDAIYRWNSVRNYWCFFSERMMGYLIRFVHNRDKATENIVTAYTRMSFLLTALEYTGADFCERLHAAAVQLPNNSSLHSANTVLVTFRLLHVFFRLLVL